MILTWPDTVWSRLKRCFNLPSRVKLRHLKITWILPISKINPEIAFCTQKMAVNSRFTKNCLDKLNFQGKFFQVQVKSAVKPWKFVVHVPKTNWIIYVVNFLYYGEIHCEKEFDSLKILENLNKIFFFSKNLAIKMPNDPIAKVFSKPVTITEEAFKNMSSEKPYSCQYCFKEYRKL